jgi:hypothetical protein
VATWRSVSLPPRPLVALTTGPTGSCNTSSYFASKGMCHGSTNCARDCSGRYRGDGQTAPKAARTAAMQRVRFPSCVQRVLPPECCGDDVDSFLLFVPMRPCFWALSK